MRTTKVILTGSMRNAGRVLSAEEVAERDRVAKIAQARKEAKAQAQMEKESAGMTIKERLKSGRFGGKIYIFTDDTEVAEEVIATPPATTKEEMDKYEEERVMEDKVIISEEGRPVRLAEVAKDRKNIRERAQEIRRERIDNAINSFWSVVNENEAHVEAELLNMVNNDPLKGTANYSFSVEIEKDAYSELILNAINNAKPEYVAYWEKDGVSAEIATFNKEDRIKVLFTYNLQY